MGNFFSRLFESTNIEYDRNTERQIAHANMAKEMTLMELAKRGYISPEEQELLSKRLMINVAQPGIISKFFKNAPKKYMVMTELDEIVVGEWEKRYNKLVDNKVVEFKRNNG